MTTINTPGKAYAPDGTHVGPGPWLELIQDRTGPGEPFEGSPTFSGGDGAPLVETYGNGGHCTHELDGTVTVSWPDNANATNDDDDDDEGALGHCARCDAALAPLTQAALEDGGPCECVCGLALPPPPTPWLRAQGWEAQD